MNTGKTLFAQLMDFLPWTTFTRIVDRYGGDHRVRTLSCAEQYRSMAFAQLTYRESLRDIETCLSVHASKLYHMGFRQPVRRSTLADANERRDWRIHAALAQRLITQARTLYVDEELGLDLTNTVYALDSTTIALCLSVFPWAHFRTTKAAVKMHTLLDLRGNIPSFIHISDGKLHDVHALDMLLPEAGAIYVVDRGYVDFARLYVLHQAGAFFVTRAKSNIDAHRVYSAPTDRSTGIICDQTISLDGFYTRQDYPELLRRIRFKDPESGKTLVFITNNFSLPAATICALYKSRWQVELFFKWIKQHLRIKQFYGTSEVSVRSGRGISAGVSIRPGPILAIEGAFPIPSQGPEPDILFRLVGLPVPVVAPAPLGGPDAGPAGGPVNGAGVARGLDEGLDEHGRGVVALGPVIGQAPADEGQDVRTQVGDIDPGQDQESRVVDHEGKVLLAQSAVSIR